MSGEAYVTVGVAFIGMMASWAVWVSVSVFKHAQEIALLKQEIAVLIEVKEVLDDIRHQLRQQYANPKR